MQLEGTCGIVAPPRRLGQCAAVSLVYWPPGYRLGGGNEKHMAHSRPVAMTIAGSDSGGGAGIQADLKTFQALGVYGTSTLTAITAQNTVAVTAVHEIPTDVIAAQIDAVVSDIGVQAAKTGMLSSAEIIATVADRVRHW